MSARLLFEGGQKKVLLEASGDEGRTVTQSAKKHVFIKSPWDAYKAKGCCDRPVIMIWIFPLHGLPQRRYRRY